MQYLARTFRLPLRRGGGHRVRQPHHRFFLQIDALDDPLLQRVSRPGLKLATKEDRDHQAMSFKINDVLKAFFKM